MLHIAFKYWHQTLCLAILTASAHADVYPTDLDEPEEGLVHFAESAGLQAEDESLQMILDGLTTTAMTDQKRLLLTDPDLLQTYSCYRIRNFTWSWPGDDISPVVGRVRFPLSSCNGGSLPNNRPLVIFMHGNKMGHRDHDYLMAHLTRNGFVTASIANSGSNEQRGQQAITYLNGLHQFWNQGHRLSSQVIFIGHSRGGEGAATAARLLHEQPDLGAENYQVAAVVAIAPTDGGSMHDEARMSLTGRMSDSFLALFGSEDNDTEGHTATLPNQEPMRTAFAHYDRAGSESGSEGLQINSPHLDKAMVYLHGAAHRDFMDPDLIGPAAGTTVGNNAAKAYINAFLRWQVWGQSQYRGFFTGSQTPQSLQSETIVHQYSAGIRRVIDDFSDGDTDVNSLGGLVYRSQSGILAYSEGPAHTLAWSSPHDTGAARVAWTNSNGSLNPLMLWLIPDQSVPWVGSLRNVSQFDALSVRMGQVYGSHLNPEGLAQNLQFRLLSDAGLSSQVDLMAYADVLPQDTFLCAPGNCQVIAVTDYSKSAMQTVRIPLQAFDNVDWFSVRAVYLYFNDPDIVTGDVTLDSLEFVRDL